MSGLIISLKPNEKFLINGAVLQNGPKRSQISIQDDDVKVLRMSDALHPTDVDSPIRRVYYLTQLILSCDENSEDMAPTILHGLKNLKAVFEGTPVEDTIDKVTHAARGERYYSVLNMLKPVLNLEKGLLARASGGAVNDASDATAHDTPSKQDYAPNQDYPKVVNG